MSIVFSFESPQSMRDYVIERGKDIYCLENKEYVYRSSNINSEIAVYSLQHNTATRLALWSKQYEAEWHNFIENEIGYRYSDKDCTEYFEDNYRRAWVDANGEFAIPKI